MTGREVSCGAEVRYAWRMAKSALRDETIQRFCSEARRVTSSDQAQPGETVNGHGSLLWAMPVDLSALLDREITELVAHATTAGKVHADLAMDEAQVREFLFSNLNELLG